jgi:hypothetical protein
MLFLQAGVAAQAYCNCQQQKRLMYTAYTAPNRQHQVLKLFRNKQYCRCATHKITSRLIAAMNSSAMTLNRQGLRFSSTWPAGHNSTRTGSHKQTALRAPVAGQA